MMPSATFAELRLGPYVVKDPERVKSVPEDLAAASAGLEKFKLISASGAKGTASPASGSSAILLAYQVMFQSARSLVHASGYHILNFRALLSALQVLYVKPGKLDAALVEALEKSQEVVADPSFYAAQAEAWLAAAKKLTS
jgi:hypothetical protein